MNFDDDLLTIKKTKINNKMSGIKEKQNATAFSESSIKLEEKLKNASNTECLSESSYNTKKVELNCKENNEQIEDIKNEQFYVKGKEYWQNVEPTVDGMLGGLAHVSGVDIAESTKFLKQFVKVCVAIF